MTERELVIAAKIAKEELEAAKEAAKTAQKAYDDAEAAIIEHLTTVNAEATASYDGVGRVQMQKPRIFANVTEANKDDLKAHLRKEGREDMIKETVATPSLSAYVGELIEQGKPIPEFIGYYLKTSLRFY